jgi:hypothetical protein
MAEPFLSREICRELVRVNRRFVDPVARERPIAGVADLLPTQEQHTVPSRLINR